jgi:hypothetical protein
MKKEPIQIHSRVGGYLYSTPSTVQTYKNLQTKKGS